MTSTIDTIIFDLGGVLIDWNPRHLYRKLFDDPERMEHFLLEIATSDWNEEQDGGRTLAEGTAWLLERHPEHREHIEAFYGRWEEMLGGPIEKTVEVLNDLRRQDRHRLYALTNWSAETWPVAWERYEFLHWFEGVLVSGQEQLRKPDTAIFELISRRFDIDLHRALFIDDNLRNVRAAEEVGLRTVHFQSGEQLREELREMGVLV